MYLPELGKEALPWHPPHLDQSLDLRSSSSQGQLPERARAGRGAPRS